MVFESGLGEDVATWSNVQPEVALFARTLAYDRAGLGKSDPSHHPKTVPEMAFNYTLSCMLRVRLPTSWWVTLSEERLSRFLHIRTQRKLQDWCWLIQRTAG